MHDENGNSAPHGEHAIECKLCGELFASADALAKHFRPGDVCWTPAAFAKAGLKQNTRGYWELRT